MKVYIIGNKVEGYYKIGISSNPKRRLKDIQISCPLILELIISFDKGEEAYNIEQQAHLKFKDYNLHSEWFELTEAQLEKAIQFLNNPSKIGIPKKHPNNSFKASKNPDRYARNAWRAEMRKIKFGY